jgi:hypothetical protein
MISVGTHGQGCLTADDYSAVALMMACNRDAVDSSLTVDQTALNGYNNRPWLLATTTGTSAISSTSLDWVPGTAFGIGAVAPGLVALTTVASGVAASLTGSFITGWWNIGGFVSYQPTGAVNNFTRRTAAIQVLHSEQSMNFYDTIVQTSVESNTGTDSMSLDGVFYIDSSFSYAITLNFAHKNTSSTIQINAGGKVWMHYLGSGVTI